MSVNAALSLIVVGAIPPPFALIRYIVRRYVDAVVENVFGSGDDGRRCLNSRRREYIPCPAYRSHRSSNRQNRCYYF